MSTTSIPLITDLLHDDNYDLDCEMAAELEKVTLMWDAHRLPQADVGK